MTVATIIIPYASYHKDVVENAIESAYAQTVKCNVVAEWDIARGTPSIVRNKAANVNTPFVVWLDADDTLEPNFVEECVKVYEQGHYVYTNWLCGDVLQKPNLCVTRDEDYHSHLVTTLYPTALFNLVGGFDERLHGHEDVDFYLRNAQSGVCGIHLDKALIHYSEHGQRSAAFTADKTAMKNTMDAIYLKNGGQRTIMACCGQPSVQSSGSPGTQQPGDVLAIALWAGMRSEVGLATRRVYVGGNQGKLWVHPADIEQSPHLFKADITNAAPTKGQALKAAGLV